MTTPNTPATPTEGPLSDKPARGRASYTFRNSLDGQAVEGVSKGDSPDIGEAGEVRHQRVSDLAATEGGSQQEGEMSPGDAAETRTRKRLRQPQQRDHVRSVRLTADELADVQNAATAMGLRVAGFLADAAVAVARAQEGPQSWLMDRRGLVEKLMRASTQLARVGNNLNQIARSLNAGGEAPYAEDVLAHVRRATAQVETAATEIAKR